MLTAYFKLNQSDSEKQVEHRQVQHLHYQDIPSLYTYDTRKEEWIHRMKTVPATPSHNYLSNSKQVLSRMYTCSPQNIELYCLRKLLLHVTAPISFDDLKTDQDGQIHHTFKESAIAHGLFSQDTEWGQCLAEASLTCMPTQMLELFSIILIHCNPTDPNQLWEANKQHFYRQEPNASGETNHVEVFHAYHKLENMIKKFNSGFTLAHTYNIPEPPGHGVLSIPQDQDYLDDADDHFALAQEMQEQLNIDQRRGFDEILEAIDSGEGKAFFIDGPGGTGKSFMYKTLIHTLTASGRKVPDCFWQKGATQTCSRSS
jgi:hypothetical protein